MSVYGSVHHRSTLAKFAPVQQAKNGRKKVASNPHSGAARQLPSGTHTGVVSLFSNRLAYCAAIARPRRINTQHSVAQMTRTGQGEHVYCARQDAGSIPAGVNTSPKLRATISVVLPKWYPVRGRMEEISVGQTECLPNKQPQEGLTLPACGLICFKRPRWAWQ